MNLGTNDKKKVGFLVGLSLVAGYVVYSNLLSGPSYPTSSKPVAAGGAADAEPDIVRGPAPAPAAAAPSQAVAPDIRRANPGSKPKGEEFHPALRSKRLEDRIDPFTVDPTLHLELLAKVQDVKPAGGQRNLFQFGEYVQTAKLDDKPVTVKPVLKYGPFPVPDKKPDPPPSPAAPPPPIPYKYYGLSTTRIDGKKTAFFLDGEDIILAPEGYIVKKKYKVVRIGATSVLMEDVDSKRQQTLQYTEDAGQNASE